MSAAKGTRQGKKNKSIKSGLKMPAGVKIHTPEVGRTQRGV